MLRSLDSYYRKEDAKIGVTTRTDGPQKLVISHNTNNRMVVPGYDNDVVFQNDKKIEEPDIRKLTHGWNMNRLNTKIIKKVDVTLDAVPEFDVFPRTVKEV